MTKKDAIYSRFEALEEHLAHCYFLLKERFITNPELARFWGEAGLDELQHAAMLRYCRERSLFRMGSLIDFSVADRVDDLLETVKGMVTDPNITVDDAFFAALLIESSELDDAYERLTQPLAQDHPFVYQAIRPSLQAHHDKFTKGATEFTNHKTYVEAFRTLARSERRLFHQSLSRKAG